MNPERWRQIEDLYNKALELDPDRRTAFLREACGGDQDLWRDLEGLLEEDPQGSFLERPALREIAQEFAATPPPSHQYWIGRQIGNYEFVSLAGAGGMGEVYRARDVKLKRDVAVKFLPEEFSLDPERVSRFQREAQLLASLNHPGIAAVYDLEEADGRQFLILELVEGETLADRLKRGPIPMEDALKIALQIAEALEAAHEKNVIHRDLKPANIKVTAEGTVKVLDFGLAKALGDERPGEDIGNSPRSVSIAATRQGVILGTAAYMSPEQATGKAVDRRADVWAFGVVLYELLTGKPAFPGEDVTEILTAVLTKDPAPDALPAKTPPGIRNLLRRCLDRNLKRRVQHMGEARIVIEDALAGVAPAAPAGPDAAPRQRRWRLAWAAAMVLAVLVAIALAANTGLLRQSIAKPIESLAVLPLENLSRDPEQEYFADGITDGLITDLAKISALRVISRTSVMQYKGTKKSIPEIARELNVDAVLEGAVTRAQDRVRITVQLIRTAPEKLLWAEKFEAGLSEVLKLQDAVTKAVAHEIQIKVTPREQTLLGTARVIDPAAYEAYLKGRYLWERPGEENLRKSREYFEQAIEKDPGYALAWAGLADAYNRLASWGVLSSQAARPRARAAAEKALELDNTLVVPLVTLAEVKMNYEWDWAGAEQLCRRAIEVNPNSGEAHHVYASYLAAVGRVQEAVAEARRAREVEPLSGVYGGNVVWKLYLARQYAEAESESLKLTTWNPNFSEGYIFASLYLQTGRQREAVAKLQKSATESNRGVLQLMFLGHALGVSGARAEGRKVLEEIQSLSQQRYVPPEYIAMVYEGLGEREQALQWFEKAYSEQSMNVWVLPDPRLDPIRTEPRFKKLMQQMGLPQ